MGIKKTQRLSNKGLFLTAEELAHLQEYEFVDLTVELSGESAFYGFALLDWLKFPEGGVKVALPQPANSVWLRASTIIFEYHKVFRNVRIPSRVKLTLINRVA